MYNPISTLLIVDDSSLVVDRLAEMIKDSTKVKEIYTATTYSEALDAIVLKQPGIVLLDIHLPGKNGIELLEHLKFKHPSIVVVMLTNQASENYRALCEKMGADHFIDKSSEFEEIPAIIEGYVGKLIKTMEN
jgi:DNA-binding NarL/FixJ family response regulator